MTKIVAAVKKLEEVILNLKAPTGFGITPALLRSPVDVACAIVKWSESISDDEIAAFDPAFAACCRGFATAVRDYRLQGLDALASAFLSRLPAEPAAADQDPVEAEGADDAN